MMKQAKAKLMPFIVLGIAMVAIYFGLILLAYLFVFGTLVGLVLYAIEWMRKKYASRSRIHSPVRRQGRTYDHEE